MFSAADLLKRIQRTVDGQCSVDLEGMCLGSKTKTAEELAHRIIITPSSGYYRTPDARC